jgi:hypothetical protein
VRVNPQTRAKIHVPARKRVKFSPGKDLAETVAASKHKPVTATKTTTAAKAAEPKKK